MAKLVYEREGINYALDGEPINIKLDFRIMPGHEDDFGWALVSIQDITARKKAEEYLRYLGTRDVMTGLYNRAFFEETISKLENQRKEPVSIIIADLNYLKRVNDTLGHQGGDKMIRRAAEVLTAAFDSAQIVARIGGDEFAVIMPDINEELALEAVKRIQVLVDLNNKYYSEPELSISLGAATSEPGLSLEKAHSSSLTMQCIITRENIIVGAGKICKAMFSAERFLTSTLQTHPHCSSVTNVLASAFNAVESGMAVKKYLHEQPLPSAQRVFAFGLGKAACAMTQALADEIKLIDTLVITKHASPLTVEPVTVIEGDHPVPGDASIEAGKAAMKFVSQLTPDDLLVCLISGGGSALMTAPCIPLADLQSLTFELLACGARIDEINILRRHLDQLKGGGLAGLAASRGARIISLLLSDVVDASFEAIASGPTAPDPTTREDALSIIEKYDLKNKIPDSIVQSLRETLKPNDPIFDRVQNTVIASNEIALSAAQDQAQIEGFQSKIVQTGMQGEARMVGYELASPVQGITGNDAAPILFAGGRRNNGHIERKWEGGQKSGTCACGCGCVGWPG